MEHETSLQYNKNLPLEPILSHFNPLFIFTSSFFNTYFNITVTSMLELSNFSFPWEFSAKIMYEFSAPSSYMSN
jgi:hypothetical protein